MEAFAIEHLTFAYPTRQELALDDVDLVIERGEFVVLCGPSGSGKTTLLRQLKPSLAPHGRREGRICWEGTPLDALDHRSASANIGFVMQNPDNQIVTDKVWHELAFGLESLGYNSASIRLRVAEMASFFGIQGWFYQQVSELSGGQRQLLALASIMAMQPHVLILDEPTSQLDPIAAAEFLQTVGRINRELGCTVILTEHRLEEAFPLASRAIVMEDGRVVADGTPQEVAEKLRIAHGAMFYAMPAPMRVWAAVPSELPCPLNVRDGREWLNAVLAVEPNTLSPGLIPARDEHAVSQDARIADERAVLPDVRTPKGRAVPQSTQTANKRSVPQGAPHSKGGAAVLARQPAVELAEVWFRYEKESSDVIRDASFKAWPGEISAVLGGNGTGKTTMLSLIAGLNRPYRGTVRLEGQALESIPRTRLFNGMLGVLPQNPQVLFTGKTVEDDLMEMFAGTRLTKKEKRNEVLRMATLCRIGNLLASHPYDLSGGEQQRAALAKVLLLKPRILLLDEPTKRFDAEFKAIFAAILRKLTRAGAAVVMVSHDIEFCAEYADRCALAFDGALVAEGTPRTFFSGNSFYTSAANRMARHVFPQAITAGDVIRELGGESSQSQFLLSDDWDQTGNYQLDENEDVAEDESDVQDNAHDSAQAVAQAGARAGARTVAQASAQAVAQASARANAQVGVRANQHKAPGRFSLRNMVVAAISAVFLLVGVIGILLDFEGFQSFISGGDHAVNTAANAAAAWKYAGIMLLVASSSVALALSLSWRRESSRERALRLLTFPERQRLSGRTLLATAMILLAIPLTIFVGFAFLDDRRYYVISLLILVEALLPFAFIFEGRKPQAREIVVIAVLCALAVAGRSAFFMLPSFKPLVALVIISAVAFGGESGFLVGALSAFISNMFFGQGPWTPWQMFACGIIGFLAGVLFQKGLLSRNRGALAVFGALAALVLYGLIMDTAMALMYQPQPTAAMFFAYYLQGIPFNLVHALATVVFLMILARPLLEKLDRIKEKYGLVRPVKGL
jgi:energy-coupling factor transport system ATP-binding protein